MSGGCGSGVQCSRPCMNEDYRVLAVGNSCFGVCLKCCLIGRSVGVVGVVVRGIGW